VTRRWRLIATGALALWPAAAGAQSTVPPPLTLNDAIQLAAQHYPALRESRARAQAAEEGIAVARAAYLPRVDLVWQENRATHNNIFGLLLPQAAVPGISGPVQGTRSFDSVWGSAAGGLLSWDAVDFGQRKAAVDSAHAQSDQAKARDDLTTLDITAATADAFLSALASDEAVRAAQANVDRLQVLARSVRTLVANQLRPGVDESRSNAELAIAKNQLSRAVQTSELARATLSGLIGRAPDRVELVSGRLAMLPSPDTAPAADVASHPAVRAELAQVEVVASRERVLEHAYLPRVTLEAALFGRGSGADVPGQARLGDGLWLQVPNWAVGASVSFPALDIFPLRARRRVELQNLLAEKARYDQTVEDLTTQEARVRALMKAAIEIARNTPIERQAATEAESRARARYENGLANITEVADATRLLAQAESDDAIARLGVWRALLVTAQVHGDLKPFVDQVIKP
jgi:outer membrane protein TolC